MDGQILVHKCSYKGRNLSSPVTTDKNCKEYLLVHFDCKSLDEFKKALTQLKSIFVPPREPDYGNEFVNNLPPSILTDRELIDMASEFGYVSSYHITKNHDGTLTGGACFRFESTKDARRFVVEMDGKEMDGCILSACQ